MSTTCMLFLHTNPLIVDFDGKVGFEPTYSRPIKTERFTIKLLTKHFGKTDEYVIHLRFELTLTILPFFFERFPQ